MVFFIRYDFDNLERCKQAFKQATELVERQYFMEGAVIMDESLKCIFVPSWFPLVPKYGKRYEKTN